MATKNEVNPMRTNQTRRWLSLSLVALSLSVAAPTTGAFADDCKMPDMVDKLARRLADGIKKKNDGKKTEEEKSYNTGWKIFIGWVQAKDECGDECKQAKKKNVGFLNPFLYANVAKGVTRDVTSGTNAIKSTVKGYKAKKGWDACTGLGTPDGTAILNNL